MRPRRHAWLLLLALFTALGMPAWRAVHRLAHEHEAHAPQETCCHHGICADDATRSDEDGGEGDETGHEGDGEGACPTCIALSCAAEGAAALPTCPTPAPAVAPIGSHACMPTGPPAARSPRANRARGPPRIC